ncbi:MAG: DUF3791 domain-containing protein [Bacteroidales bacterium]|nr:DUF3791 domain-containing protein [Candidatus Minthousia equi]
MNTKDRIEYIVALINEFAKRYNLTDAQAVEYLTRYNAISLCERNYGYLHTQSFYSNVNDISAYCRRMGGNL